VPPTHPLRTPNGGASSAAAEKLAPRPRQSSRQRRRGRLLADDSSSVGHVRELSISDTPHQGILYWNAIYTQLALDALSGRSADDELAGVMPTIFERVDALGIYTFDADRHAGQLRPLRAA
jgi:hypothetical protein